MNRRNYTVHFALAASIIFLAALAGQVSRWESARKGCTAVRKTAQPVITAEPPVALDTLRGDAEVLVRLRPGVSEERMQAIAARLHDRVEDEIESVEGLAAIDDLDGEQAEQVAEEYAALPEVEYAEPNFLIAAEPP